MAEPGGGVTDSQLAVLLRQTQWALDAAAHDYPAGRVTAQQREELAASLEALATIVRASASSTETPAGRRLSDPRLPAPGGQPEPTETTETVRRHRIWCAPDCPGGVEREHLSRPVGVTPEEEPTGRVALRLVDEPTEDGPDEVRVLVSVTERRLAGDLDPFGGSPGEQVGGGLAGITASVGLSAEEAGRLSEELVATAREARELSRMGKVRCVAQLVDRPLARSEKITGRERDRIAARLRERYVSGATIRDLVAQTGRSYGWVRTVLLEVGVVLRLRGGDHAPAATNAMANEVAARAQRAGGDEPAARHAVSPRPPERARDQAVGSVSP